MKTCTQCGKEAEMYKDYHYKVGDSIICKECHAQSIFDEMDKKGDIWLLLSREARKDTNIPTLRVQNWPPSVLIPILQYTTGGHNWACKRTDVWFKDRHGFQWHGVELGTGSIHCRIARNNSIICIANWTYEKANAFLSPLDKYRIAYRTHIARETDHIRIRLFSTDIIKLYPDGRTELSMGNWGTHLTHRRINEYLPSHWRTYRDRQVNFLAQRDNGKEGHFVFENGITIHPNNKVTGFGDPPSIICTISIIGVESCSSKNFVGFRGFKSAYAKSEQHAKKLFKEWRWVLESSLVGKHIEGDCGTISIEYRSPT